MAYVNGKEAKFYLPPELQHEQALIYAEEWYHGLQFLNGKQTLMGQSDPESDVVFYFREKGVPMTDAFLGRYGRRKALESLKNG